MRYPVLELGLTGLSISREEIDLPGHNHQPKIYNDKWHLLIHRLWTNGDLNPAASWGPTHLKHKLSFEIHSWCY